MPEPKTIEMDDLIAKYLSNNASDKDVEVLEQWVLADRQNKLHFIEMKKAWTLSGMQQTGSSNKTEKAWTTISKQLFEDQEAKVIPLYRKPFAIAASIALLVVSGWLLLQFMNQEQENTFMATTTNVSKPYELADGSQIVLNQESNLTFETKDEKRIAKLKGDAYFDIARDESQPFIIQTDKIEIKVLGTAFYVDSRNEQPETQVIVEEGKVAVTSDQQTVTLVAGDKAIFNKSTGKLVKVTNEDKNFNSLKTNVLSFDNSNLQEVAFTLNRQYNIDVSLDNQQLKQCELTSTFKQKPLKSVLKVIEATLGVTIQQKGKQVTISGNCN